MKFYIVARFRLKEVVRDIHKQLQKRGHEIVADWTTHLEAKPYDENIGLARQYSIEDINGAKSCDVFIILSDEAGTNVYGELGAAIVSHLEHGKPKIYVIGDHTARSMFYFHPSVNRRRTIDEVLEELEGK